MAIRVVEQDQPNVVLTDIRMPPSHTDEGIRVADELRQTLMFPADISP